MGASIMPLNSPAYACNYNWFVFLHENSYFLFKIISKYIPKRINHKFLGVHENNYYPNSNRVFKIVILLYKKMQVLKFLYKKW